MAWRWLILFGLPLLYSTSPTAEAQESAEERFRSALIEYFRPLRFFPVIVNAGYSLGDVIDIDGVTVLYRGSDCFPGLKRPAPLAMSLPDYAQVRDAGMNFGLRLRRLFDSSAGLDLDHDIRIHFESVSVVTSTLSELRKKYVRSACPEIAPLLDGTPIVPTPGQHPFFVVSAVMYGKHSAVVHSEGSANLQAGISKIVRVAGNLGLHVQAVGANSISLTNNVTVPIAVRPITIPRSVEVTDFDLRGGTTKGIQWQPNDADADTQSAQLFLDFSATMKRTPPALAESDREE